jgi:phage terminase large subunit
MSAVLPGTCYIESPKQRLYAEAALSGRYRELYYGGAIRGGKSFAVMALLFLLCKVFPGSRWAIVRQDLPTLRRNILPVFEKMRLFTGGFMGRMLQDTWTATATNGSQILLFPESHDTDKTKNRWRGLEVNGIWLEEANELEESSYEKSKERAGSYIIPGLAQQPLPYIFLTSNPAGNWVKRRFYTPFKNGTLRPHQFYIPATPKDNPHLTKAYLDSLEEMNERDYKIFVLGDWDELTGSAIEELDPRIHLIEPFRIPDHWIRFGSHDWGYKHPFRFGVYAANEDGRIVKVQTVGGQRMKDSEMIDYIIEATATGECMKWMGCDATGLAYVVAGHDAWNEENAKEGSTTTTALRFAAAGIPMIKAVTARIAGLKTFREQTTWKRKDVTEKKTRDGVIVKTYAPGVPNFRWFVNAGNRASFQNCADMILDPERPEDVLKVNAGEDGKGGDDDYDETRYGLQSRVVAPAQPEGDVPDDRHPGFDLKHKRLRSRKRSMEPDDDLHPNRYRVPVGGASFGEDIGGGGSGWHTPQWGSNGGEDDE